MFHDSWWNVYVTKRKSFGPKKKSFLLPYNNRLLQDIDSDALVDRRIIYFLNWINTKKSRRKGKLNFVQTLIVYLCRPTKTIFYTNIYILFKLYTLLFRILCFLLSFSIHFWVHFLKFSAEKEIFFSSKFYI